MPQLEIDGLHVTGIERIELQIDSVSTKSEYAVSHQHDIALATAVAAR